MNMTGYKRIHNVCYYTLLFLLTFEAAVQHSQILFPLYQKIGSGFTVLIIGLCGVIVFTGEIRVNALLAAVAMGAVGLVMYVQLGRMFMIHFTIIAVFIVGKDLKKINNIMFFTVGSIFLFNILCTFYFILFDLGQLYIRRSVLEPRPQLDLSCGGHPNHAAFLYVFILCMAVYKKWEKIRLNHWIIVMALSCVIYFIIGSEAVIVVTVLPIVWFLRESPGALKIGRGMIRYSIPILLAVSLIYMWSEHIPGINILANWLNEISSGRFGLSIAAMQKYPFTLFGSDVAFGMIESNFESVYVYADNAYVYMLIKGGAVYLAVLGIITFRAARNIDVREIAVIEVFLIYGLAETTILSFVSLFPLLVAIYYGTDKTQYVNS